MTQEEQDAILGRTLRLYGEAKRRLAALKTRRREISEACLATASAIRDYVGQLLEVEVERLLKNAPTADSIEAHLVEYAKAEKSVKELRQQLAEQGYGDQVGS